MPASVCVCVCGGVFSAINFTVNFQNSSCFGLGSMAFRPCFFRSEYHSYFDWSNKGLKTGNPTVYKSMDDYLRQNFQFHARPSDVSHSRCKQCSVAVLVTVFIDIPHVLAFEHMLIYSSRIFDQQQRPQRKELLPLHWERRFRLPPWFFRLQSQGIVGTINVYQQKMLRKRTSHDAFPLNWHSQIKKSNQIESNIKAVMRVCSNTI